MPLDQSKTKENDVSFPRSCHQVHSKLLPGHRWSLLQNKQERKFFPISLSRSSVRGKERCPSVCPLLPPCIGWLLTHTIRTAQSQHQGSGGHPWKKAGHVQTVGAMCPACQLKEWTPSSSFLCVGNSSLDSGIRPKLLISPIPVLSKQFSESIRNVFAALSTTRTLAELALGPALPGSRAA